MAEASSEKAVDRRLRPFERIQRPIEFQAVLRHGRCFRDPLLRIHFLEKGREYSRLGLVVSRKVGKAVERNRLKRMFRELFRLRKWDLPVPADLVFIPSPQKDQRERAAYAQVVDRFIGWQRSRAAARPGGSGSGKA
jgi:ribonuclease P protein component